MKKRHWFLFSEKLPRKYKRRILCLIKEKGYYSFLPILWHAGYISEEAKEKYIAWCNINPFSDELSRLLITEEPVSPDQVVGQPFEVDPQEIQNKPPTASFKKHLINSLGYEKYPPHLTDPAN